MLNIVGAGRGTPHVHAVYVIFAFVFGHRHLHQPLLDARSRRAVAALFLVSSFSPASSTDAEAGALEGDGKVVARQALKDLDDQATSPIAPAATIDGSEPRPRPESHRFSSGVAARCRPLVRQGTCPASAAEVRSTTPVRRWSTCSPQRRAGRGPSPSRPSTRAFRHPGGDRWRRRRVPRRRHRRRSAAFSDLRLIPAGAATDLCRRGSTSGAGQHRHHLQFTTADQHLEGQHRQIHRCVATGSTRWSTLAPKRDEATKGTLQYTIATLVDGTVRPAGTGWQPSTARSTAPRCDSARGQEQLLLGAAWSVSTPTQRRTARRDHRRLRPSQPSCCTCPDAYFSGRFVRDLLDGSGHRPSGSAPTWSPETASR